MLVIRKTYVKHCLAGPADVCALTIHTLCNFLALVCAEFNIENVQFGLTCTCGTGRRSLHRWSRLLGGPTLQLDSEDTAAPLTLPTTHTHTHTALS